MPAGDGTGPRGMGPMTGRGAGHCAGYDMPGYANPTPRRGFGLGWGRGWRRRNWFCATGVPGWARSGHAPAWGAPPPDQVIAHTNLSGLGLHGASHRGYRLGAQLVHGLVQQTDGVHAQLLVLDSLL